MTSITHALLYDVELDGVLKLTETMMFDGLNKDVPVYSKSVFVS